MLEFKLIKSPFDNDGIAVVQPTHTGNSINVPYATLFKYIIGNSATPSLIHLHNGKVICPRCLYGVCEQPQRDDYHATDEHYKGVLTILKSNCVCNKCLKSFTIHDSGHGWEYDMPHIDEPMYNQIKKVMSMAVGETMRAKGGVCKKIAHS